MRQLAQTGSVLFVVLLAASWSATVFSQTSPTAAPIRYTVDLRAPALHLVRVTMTTPETPLGAELQFPAWNNLYQVRDFIRNVQELEAQCDGRAVELAPADVNTWRAGQACSKLEVRYAVYANEESPFSTILDEQHAFLNFALLLFYLPGQRSRPARVSFLLPEGWKLATLLEEEGTEFKAADYDTLADSPAEAGRFEEYDFTQDPPLNGAGRGSATYRVIVYADGVSVPAERLLESIQKITTTETALMGDAPFDRYTFLLHFGRTGGGGGMEHRNGTAISLGDPSRNWEGIESTVAHEFFHLWNVKRIRPQSLEPIDYQHGNDTRDLWFSEGVTSTYQELTLLRAGLISRKTFLDRLAREIGTLEQRPARRFQSVDEAGRDAWLEKYPDYSRRERSISYYNKGELLGFLLDLAIRRGSGNRHSLDDLMRRLNEDFARRGRFFNQADLRAIIAQLAPGFTGVDAFFHDYVSGTAELDYDKFFGYAGLRLVTETRTQADLGFVSTRAFEGAPQVELVQPGSDAERAGLERGDVLLKMNGQPLETQPEAQLDGEKPGHKVKFQVRRGKRTREIEFRLGAKTETTFEVREIPQASPEQIRLRDGWLEGNTEAR